MKTHLLSLMVPLVGNPASESRSPETSNRAPTQAARGQGSAATPRIDSQEILEAVDDQLLTDQGVISTRINTSVDEGIVTLTGRVSSLFAKERAARIAMAVRGVRGVINRVTVEPRRPVGAEQLQIRVREALNDNPATDAYEVTVETDSTGSVRLSDLVDSWQERDLAETVAKGVSGVTELSNHITVAQRNVARGDIEIQDEIEQALRLNAFVDDGMLTVSVTNGNVVLSGVAGSASEKQRAKFLAYVAGVRPPHQSAFG